MTNTISATNITQLAINPTIITNSKSGKTSLISTGSTFASSLKKDTEFFIHFFFNDESQYFTEYTYIYLIISLNRINANEGN